MPDLTIKNIDLKNSQSNYIDLDEYNSLLNQGVIIPENVIIVPVSLSKNPETFNKIVEAKEALPDIEINELSDMIKSFMNPDALTIDIPKLCKFFPGESAIKVVQDIQAGNFISDETANILSKEGILIPGSDNLKFKKLLPFLGVPVLPKKKAMKKVAKKTAKAAKKAAKVTGKVTANVMSFGIAGLMKKASKKRKAKKAAKAAKKSVTQQAVKQAAMAQPARQVLQVQTPLRLDMDESEMYEDRFIGAAITAGIAGIKLGSKAAKKIKKKAKTKKAAKIAAKGGYASLTPYQKSLIPVPASEQKKAQIEKLAVMEVPEIVETENEVVAVTQPTVTKPVPQVVVKKTQKKGFIDELLSMIGLQ